MNDPQTELPQHFRPVQIIGVASGHGAQDRGCASGPEMVRQAGLAEQLAKRGIHLHWRAMLYAQEADELAAVTAICTELAEQVSTVVKNGECPLVLGGDHSCAIGTWKGVLQAQQPIGLIWIDAHMDAHTVQTSPSGALHGMPLACLLGHGVPALTGIAGGLSLDPRHVCLIGVRSFEQGEAALLAALGVRIFYMSEVEQRGLDAVMRDALSIVQTGTAGFGITIDLDALDPDETPAVGSPVAGGIRQAALLKALSLLAAHPALLAVELAEYNPAHDNQPGTLAFLSAMIQTLMTAPQ